MGTRSRQLGKSLGSSWGDADYFSEDGDSLRSASDLSGESDLAQSDTEVTQFPASNSAKTKRQHLSQSTPVALSQTKQHKARTSGTASGIVSRSPQSMRNSRSTPRSTKSQRPTSGPEPSEPSFIMPTMGQDFNEPTPRSPSVRQRKPRQPSSRSSTSYPSGKSWSSSSRRIDTPQETEVGPWYYLNLVLENLVLPIFKFVLEASSYGFRQIVKPILGLALGIGFVYLVLASLGSMLQSTISTALVTPICAIPGSSYIIPFCTFNSVETQHANFEELVNVQGQFEDIVEASKDVSALPSTIKNSEIAIRDLRTLVRYSRLPSRRELDNEFEYFIQTANEASIELSRYNTRIGATLDRVIATNTWTMNVLNGMSEQQASEGAATRLLTSLTSSFVASSPTLHQRVFDQYISHVSRNKEEITRLIEMAQALLQILDNLQERLGLIFEIATNDDQTITKNHEELLSTLWTKLGGNRSNVKANQQSINLLKNINAYRKQAIVHVSTTLLKLQEIQAELENLREGVAAPEVLGYRAEVPLTYYIDVIQKGVERLSATRGEARQVEGANVRRLLHGEQGARELPGPEVVVSVK